MYEFIDHRGALNVCRGSEVTAKDTFFKLLCTLGMV